MFEQLRQRQVFVAEDSAIVLVMEACSCLLVDLEQFVLSPMLDSSLPLMVQMVLFGQKRLVEHQVVNSEIG